MLMIRNGFVFIMIGYSGVNVIAVTSLNGNVNDIIWDVDRRLLFRYISPSMIVYRWMSLVRSASSTMDDFVYIDQYCSCSISIVYHFMSGSLRMVSVSYLFLGRFFCSISR